VPDKPEHRLRRINQTGQLGMNNEVI